MTGSDLTWMESWLCSEVHCHWNFLVNTTFISTSHGHPTNTSVTSKVFLNSTYPGHPELHVGHIQSHHSNLFQGLLTPIKENKATGPRLYCFLSPAKQTESKTIGFDGFLLSVFTSWSSTSLQLQPREGLLPYSEKRLSKPLVPSSDTNCWQSGPKSQTRAHKLNQLFDSCIR